jgi:hypothetical protein
MLQRTKSNTTLEEEEQDPHCFSHSPLAEDCNCLDSTQLEELSMNRSVSSSISTKSRTLSITLIRNSCLLLLETLVDRPGGCCVLEEENADLMVVVERRLAGKEEGRRGGMSGCSDKDKRVAGDS